MAANPGGKGGLEGSPTGATDADLIGRLYVEQGARIRRICGRYLPAAAGVSIGEADDAVQETFVRALRYRGRLADARDATRYLDQIARGVCLDLIRARDQLADRLPIMADLCPNGDPVAEVSGRLNADAIWRELTPLQQRVVRRRLAGMSSEEAAEDLGLHPGTVRGTLHRARIKLTSLVERGLLGPGHTIGRLLAWLRSRIGSGQASFFRAPDALAAVLLWIAVAVAVSALATTARGATHSGAPASSPALGERAYLAELPAAGSWNGVRMIHRVDLGRSPADKAPNRHGYVDRVLKVSATPNEVFFSSISTAPGGGEVALAVGKADPRVCWLSTNCPVIFRTTDAGRTWGQLPAAGFLIGPVLTSSRYPRDATLFAVASEAPFGVERSRDGGSTFELAAPALRGPATVVPGAGVGDDIVVIATPALALYREDTGLVEPGPALPVGMMRVDSVANAGDSRVLITGEFADLTSSTGTSGRVAICQIGTPACIVDPAATLPGPAVQLSAVGSQLANGEWVDLVFGGGAAELSTDGGRHFSLIRQPASAPIQAGTVAAGSGDLLLETASLGSDGLLHGELLDTNGSSPFTWHEHALGLFPGVLVSPTLLPSGAILAARFHHMPGQSDLVCSTDWGTGWSNSCR